MFRQSYCRVGAECTAIDRARADFAAWTQLIVVLRKSHLDIWPARNMRSADIWFSSSSTTLTPDWQCSVTGRDSCHPRHSHHACICVSTEVCTHARAHTKSSLVESSHWHPLPRRLSHRALGFEYRSCFRSQEPILDSWHAVKYSRSEEGAAEVDLAAVSSPNYLKLV